MRDCQALQCWGASGPIVPHPEPNVPPGLHLLMLSIIHSHSPRLKPRDALPDVLGQLRQLHLFHHGIVGDGQDGHAQTLVLDVVSILLSLGVTNGSQTFDQIILSLWRRGEKR